MHKTFINSLDLTLEFKGASPRERLKPTEEEKGQAGRPRVVGPAGLLSVASNSLDFSSANSLMLPKLMFY